MFSREGTPEPCGEAYYSELDIIENFSYTGPGASDWWNGKQHVNTHVWATDASCNRISPSTQWKGSSRDLEGPLDFNVVGAWWVDKDSVQFYLNGKHWHTIEYLKDSYMPMPLILTMETYTWGSDENNADNPKPEEYMFQDDFRTREQRAVYYDWVRTWDLVEIDTSIYNIERDTVGFLEKPLELYEDSIIDVSLLYSATESRRLAIALFKDEMLLASDTTTVDAGVASANQMLEAGQYLEAGDYRLVSDMMEAEGGAGELFGTDTCELKITVKPIETLLFDKGFPKQVFPSSTYYKLEVYYQGASDMEIAVEVRDPAGAWIGGGVQQVSDGSGVATIRADLIRATSPGTGYYWKSHIRPRGTTWRESVHALNFIPFSVVEEPAWELELESGGWPLADTVNGVDVSACYNALADAGLTLSISRPGDLPVADTSLEISEGEGCADIFLVFKEKPQAGSDYRLTGTLTETAAQEIRKSDTLEALEIVEVPDSGVFVPQTDFPYRGIRIWPNPGDDLIRIEMPAGVCGICSVWVSDMSGRVLIWEENYENELDISSLGRGSYLIRILSEGLSFHAVLIKE